MPLNFQEVEKPKEPVEFFVINTKARPQDLEGEVLPELIRRCGDVKSGRISAAMVEAYLDRNTLVFDRAMVKSLFSEADYKKEGSLDARTLKAALSARYPKRQLHREWRQLAALLMGLPELNLADDIVDPKVYDGTFNKMSVWDEPAKELPKPPPRRPRAKKASTNKDPTDFTSTSSTLNTTTSGSTTQSSANTVRTPEGLKTTQPSHIQATLNAAGFEQGKCTLAAAREFERQQKGLELEGAFSHASKAWAVGELTEKGIMTSSKGSVKAWGATLPPTAVHIPTSALKTLRSSVRSTMATKSEFVTTPSTLTAAETDLKKTLGQPMDVTVALNRVEPVRPTSINPRGDYLQWGDYSSRTCRTAPTNWYSDHPAAEHT